METVTQRATKLRLHSTPIAIPTGEDSINSTAVRTAQAIFGGVSQSSAVKGITQRVAGFQASRQRTNSASKPPVLPVSQTGEDLSFSRVRAAQSIFEGPQIGPVPSGDSDSSGTPYSAEKYIDQRRPASKRRAKSSLKPIATPPTAASEDSVYSSTFREAQETRIALPDAVQTEPAPVGDSDRVAILDSATQDLERRMSELQAAIYPSAFGEAQQTQPAFPDVIQTGPAPVGDSSRAEILDSATKDLERRMSELQAFVYDANLPPELTAFPVPPTGEASVYPSGFPEVQNTEDAVTVTSHRGPNSVDSESTNPASLRSAINDATSQRASELKDTTQPAKPSLKPITIPPTPNAASAATGDELYCSWSRIIASTTAHAFPSAAQTGRAPFRDADDTPVFIGSAILEWSVEPCRIAPGSSTEASCVSVSVAYDGTEYFHEGRYDLVPESEWEQMEWVPTARGNIPSGRRPVVGGYDENDNTLYHAAAYIEGIKVPGKTGQHLGGALVSFGHEEHEFGDNYDILCWK